MNIKKIGLTALAGSLVATTAFAGTMTLSGAAKLSHTSKDASAAGARTGGDAATPFAMDNELTASGSAELDNGMTVSVSHGLATGGSASGTSTLTLDMGDMGKLAYSDADIGGGLKALDDKTPTAYEEVTNGVADEVQAAMGNGAGFAYSNTVGGASIGITYADNTGSSGSTDGKVGSGTGSSSSTSVGVTYPVGDTGLTVYGGVGTEGQADTTEIDHTTYGATYAFGPVTIGAQVNDEDNSAADNTVAADEDLETTIMGISFAVNENLSISYGEHTTTSTATSAVDQELEGINISYSMGGMTLAIGDHEGENISNVENVDNSETEILLTFAF
jgi:outer membrane protein OmpU